MTTIPRGRHRRVRSRGVAAMWVAGAAAAAVVSLGVNGTLSSWTSALINNNSNTVATANAVILKETGPGASPTTCTSSDAGFANSITACGVNKYGGVTSPLNPGGSQTVTVTMANLGSTSGTLTVKANSACSYTGGINSGATSACAVVQMKLECPTGTAVYPTTGTVSLDTFTGAAASTVGTLAAGASVSCTFTVSLPATASPTVAGQSLTQQILWTLA